MVRSTVFFLLFIFNIHNGNTKKIPRWWLKVAQEQGPNACVVETLPGTHKEFWTECRYSLQREICGEKTQLRFECCEGYEQVDGEDGCTMVKPLKNVLETAEDLGATKWVQYIRGTEIQYILEEPGAFTLFAPTNEAFETISRSLKSQMNLHRGSSTNPIILYHILTSKEKSGNFKGDQTVETRYRGHNIRINKYSNGMTTINCALLLRKDQEATNGVVHVIDAVLDPSLQVFDNVVNAVLNDGRFEVFSDILIKSGYVHQLRTLHGSATIMAPSDEAFQKLPEERWERVVNDHDTRLAILQNHVIPHLICESAITGEHRVGTLANNKITFNCGPNGTYVENTKMRKDFIFGKNGIIHMVDDLLLPDQVKNLVELAKSRKLETFVELVKQAGLEDTFTNTGDYTLFVPEEKAWLEMPPETIVHARQNPEYAQSLIRYQGAYGRHLTNGIKDNEAIMSLDYKNPIRLMIWRKSMGVEDAKITEPDIEAQNGVIHIISKVIFPSNKSIEDVLYTINEHSFLTFIEILKEVTSDPDSLIDLRPDNHQFYTFFVPTDWAFSSQNQNKLGRILTDRDKMEQLFLNHVVENMYPEISFQSDLKYSLGGLGGNNLKVKKSPRGQLSVNGVRVLISLMSSNGVIHIIDDVFIPEDFGTVLKRRHSYARSRKISRINSSHDEGTNRKEHYIIGENPHNKETTSGILVESGRRKTSFRVPENASIDNSHEDDFPYITIYESYSTSHLYDNSTRKTKLIPYLRLTNHTSVNNTKHSNFNTRPDSLYSPSKTKNEGNFSYIGHSYGNDIVGHSSSQPLLPLKLREESFISNNKIEKSLAKNSTSIGLSKSYSYPRTSETPLHREDSIENFSLDKTLILDNDSDFADGYEFQDKRPRPSRPDTEELITIEQAKILRRQWRRRKRHHKDSFSRRKNNKIKLNRKHRKIMYK